MKINQILSQHRRDFTVIYKCEHCPAMSKGTGYDDDNFHKNVIPNMTCSNCGKKAPESYRELTPKYAAHEIV